MDEARKTNRLRTEEFKKQYLVGRVIDIGCGPDLVAPHGNRVNGGLLGCWREVATVMSSIIRGRNAVI
jgi:hypothetical protein